jgi:hypothetical protein
MMISLLTNSEIKNMSNELAYRDIDTDVEEVLRRRGFNLYDTEEVSSRRCEDCGRKGHCEC